MQSKIQIFFCTDEDKFMKDFAELYRTNKESAWKEFLETETEAEKIIDYNVVKKKDIKKVQLCMFYFLTRRFKKSAKLCFQLFHYPSFYFLQAINFAALEKFETALKILENKPEEWDALDKELYYYLIT